MREKKLTKLDKFNIWLGIFNFIGVIIAVSISIWGVKKGEEIAERSGDFDKGDLSLSFGGVFIKPSVEFDVYFGLKFPDTSLHFLELPITIYNGGKKTVEDAALTFKYLHLYNIALNDSLIQYDAGSISKISRTMRANLPYDEVSFAMSSINPNVSIRPSEFICAQREETKGEVRLSGYTRDSVLLNTLAKYTYSYPIIIGLMGKDIISKVYQVKVNYRKGNDLEKLITKILDEKRSLRKENKSTWNNGFFVIIPRTKEIVGDNLYKLTFMNADEKSILYCQFDVENKHVIVFTSDGKAKQLIDF